jgi:AcrR family transcriptional regulator
VTGEKTTASRRRGRRPAGSDTRGAILAAARAEFAERGFEGTSVRGLARRAGVDPRLVHHYFDGKEEIFLAAMEIPVRLSDLAENLTVGPQDELGERLAGFFFGVWDSPEGRMRITGLIRSAVSHEAAANMIRELLSRVIFTRIEAQIRADDPELRVTLVASQLAGVAMLRYVLQIEPLATLPVDRLVAHLAPTLQRYLVG